MSEDSHMSMRGVPMRILWETICYGIEVSSLGDNSIEEAQAAYPDHAGVVRLIGNYYHTIYKNPHGEEDRILYELMNHIEEIRELSDEVNSR